MRLAIAPSGWSEGRMTVARHTPTPVTAPGFTIQGKRPALAKDDLPAPLGPTISKKGKPASAASFKRSSARARSPSRPKNTSACLAPNLQAAKG